MPDGIDFEFDTGQGPEALADDLETLADALDRHLEEAMEEAVLRIEADAKRNAPVDTGRLRSSIASEVNRRGESQILGSVGSNLVYSKFVETGTRHMPASPYLGPAVEQNISEIESLFQQALEDAVGEVA